MHIIKRVYLPEVPNYSLTIQGDAEPLSVVFNGGVIVYVAVDPNVEKDTILRFVMVGTEQRFDYDPCRMKFLGTVVDHGYVGQVFVEKLDGPQS